MLQLGPITSPFRDIKRCQTTSLSLQWLFYHSSAPLANFRRPLSGLLIPRCWSLVRPLLSRCKVCSTSVFCFVLCRVSSGEENRAEYWQLCHLMGFIMSRSKIICRKINTDQDIHTIHVHCTLYTSHQITSNASTGFAGKMSNSFKSSSNSAWLRKC